MHTSELRAPISTPRRQPAAHTRNLPRFWHALDLSKPTCAPVQQAQCKRLQESQKREGDGSKKQGRLNSDLLPDTCERLAFEALCLFVDHLLPLSSLPLANKWTFNMLYVEPHCKLIAIASRSGTLGGLTSRERRRG